MKAPFMVLTSKLLPRELKSRISRTGREKQMARMKLKTLREFNVEDLKGKLSELRADLSKLRSDSAKGTLKKETGNIKWIRRDIARILTILNESSARG
jgi:large subunit ribosomal protein L29